MKRYLLTGAFGLTLTLSAALLGSAALAQQRSLTLGGLGADIGQLDPHFATSASDRTVVAWIYNGLVRFAPGTSDPAQIEPDLAESWEASDDNLVWTFRLRPGVQWQQGFGEVTAADVAFSLDKARNPETSAFASDYSAIAGVEALDDLTVRITLSRPVPSLLALLTNYSGGFIIPQAAYAARGADFTRSPVGSGPFAVASIDSGIALNLVAHDGYFRGAPQIDTVTYRFMPTNSARDLAFQAGELDAAAGVQNQNWLTRASAIPGAVVDVFDPAELTVLHLDANKAPLTDIRVRQAIAHAVSAEQMVQFQGASFTRVALSPIPSDNLGYTPDAGALPHDPDRARALLAEAGYPNGVAIEMIASQLPQLEGIAQVLQAQLQNVGVTLNLRPVEHATWHQNIRQDLNAITIYGAARFPVADFYLTQFYHSASTVGTPTAVTNFSHCAVADAAIEAARVEADPAAQLAHWHEAQRLILAEVCGIPLIETTLPWIRREALDWGYELRGSMSLGPVLTEATRFTE